MNPWNALLESFHSALIDELNVRLPALKPELGLPKRSRGFELPDPRISEVWCFGVTLESASPAGGKVLLGLSPSASKQLKLTVKEFAASVLKRANPVEFTRRSVAPMLDAGTIQSVPSNPDLKMIIWMPMKIEEEPVFLGVGVF